MWTIINVNINMSACIDVMAIFHQCRPQYAVNYVLINMLIMKFQSSFTLKYTQFRISMNWFITYLNQTEFEDLIDICPVPCIASCLRKTLTHWGWYKMFVILLTTFSNAITSMKTFEFWKKDFIEISSLLPNLEYVGTGLDTGLVLN